MVLSIREGQAALCSGHRLRCHQLAEGGVGDLARLLRLPLAPKSLAPLALVTLAGTSLEDLCALSTSWLRTASSAQGVVFDMNFDSLLDDILLDQPGQVSHDGDTLVGT